MKIKKISELDRIKTNLEPFINNGNWRLLGAIWQKRIEVSIDKSNGDIILRYD